MKNYGWKTKGRSYCSTELSAKRSTMEGGRVVSKVIITPIKDATDNRGVVKDQHVRKAAAGLQQSGRIKTGGEGDRRSEQYGYNKALPSGNIVSH